MLPCYPGFCASAAHLVDAVKQGFFFVQMLTADSMRTVALATMHMMKPEDINKNENINLVYEFFDRLDDEYDFQLGPTLLSLSSNLQLQQMSKLDLPYLRDYVHMINDCIERQDCTELDDVLQNRGTFFTTLHTFHT